jgi:hypothetical protein
MAPWPADQSLPSSFQTQPYVTLLSPTSVVVSWRTVSNATAQIEVAPVPGGVVISPPSSQQHFVTLSGLAPNTAYFYRARVDGAFFDGVFTTPGADFFRFAHFGEFHAPEYSSKAATFSTVMRSFEPDFLVDSGDMVDTGTDLTHFINYLNTSKPWLPNLLLIPAYFRHIEWNGGNNLMASLFRLPNGNPARPWYSIRYGSLKLLILSSYFYSGNLPPALIQEQKDWVSAQVIQAHDGVEDPVFLVAAWHHPPYGEAQEWVNERALVIENLLTPIEQSGGVDLLLVGAEHINEVSYKTYADGKPPLWQVQSATGSLRTWDNNLNPHRVFTYTAKEAIFLADVQNRTLSGRLVTADNTTLYQFQITKP